MAIQIRYFASLREQMGRPGDSLPSAASMTVADVWAHVAGGLSLPVNTLVAINMEYSRLDATVNEGDEVAFFPPVTGG